MNFRIISRLNEVMGFVYDCNYFYRRKQIGKTGNASGHEFFQFMGLDGDELDTFDDIYRAVIGRGFQYDIIKTIDRTVTFEYMIESQ